MSEISLKRRLEILEKRVRHYENRMVKDRSIDNIQRYNSARKQYNNYLSQIRVNKE